MAPVRPGGIARGTGRTYRGNMTITTEAEPEAARRQAPVPGGGEGVDDTSIDEAGADGERGADGRGALVAPTQKLIHRPPATGGGSDADPFTACGTDRADGRDKAVGPSGWRAESRRRPDVVSSHPLSVSADHTPRVGSVPRAKVVPRRSGVAVGAIRPALLRWWAVVLAVGVVVATMLEPVPDGPQADQTPVLIDVIGNVTLVLLFAALVGLFVGRRWGLGAATYAGAGLVALSALCPASGHHDVAAWWFAQLAISVGLFAGSLVLRSRASTPARP